MPEYLFLATRISASTAFDPFRFQKMLQNKGIQSRRKFNRQLLVRAAGAITLLLFIRHRSVLIDHFVGHLGPIGHGHCKISWIEGLPY